MPSVGDVYEMIVYCTCGNQTSLNVRHWEVTGLDPGDFTDLDIAEAYNTRMRPEYLPLMSADANYWGCTVQKIRPLPIFERAVAPFIAAGEEAAEVLPRQTAGVISLRTGVASRRKRGRVYVPFPAETQNEGDGQPTAAYLTDLESLAIAYMVPFNIVDGAETLTLESRVFSRLDNAFTPITDYILRSGWGTIRKRGFFGKPNGPPA